MANCSKNITKARADTYIGRNKSPARFAAAGEVDYNMYMLYLRASVIRGVVFIEWSNCRMARVTVEDAVDRMGNRFDLVMLASKRSRQLAIQGKDPMVDWDNDKPTVVALREIEEGLLTQEVMDQLEAQSEEVAAAPAEE